MSGSFLIHSHCLFFCPFAACSSSSLLIFDFYELLNNSSSYCSWSLCCPPLYYPYQYSLHYYHLNCHHWTFPPYFILHHYLCHLHYFSSQLYDIRHLSTPTVLPNHLFHCCTSSVSLISDVLHSIFLCVNPPPSQDSDGILQCPSKILLLDCLLVFH
jgi:hypothetical protein